MFQIAEGGVTVKKLIVFILLLFAVLIGTLIYQVNEKITQDEVYEEAAVFFQEEDYKKAIQFFEEAKDHNNLFSGDLKKDLSYYQAEAHMKLGEFEEALKIYESMIAENGKESIPYVMKAYCLIGLEEEETAASVYKDGYDNTKDPEFVYYLANQYVTMEQYEDAANVIHTYQNIEDEDIARRLAFLEIIIYEEQQQYEKAYELAEAYCDKYPEDEDGLKEKTFLESRQ